MAFLLHFIRQNDVFVDVGSNVGVYTILAAENGAKCNAFEPVPATFAALQQNVRVNDFQFVPELYNVAVGASSGEILFSSGLDAMNHALADGENTEKAIRVPVMPLDSYSLQPTMMKIDVEGFETEVLTGGAKTFNEHSLIAVLMELNGAGSRYGHSDKTLEETMANAGFTPFSYDPFSRRLAPIHSSRGKGNVLFIRNKEMVDERITSAPLRKINGIEF
jgi:FkbM family methyltransferase